jgi:hypothetical protein
MVSSSAPYTAMKFFGQKFGPGSLDLTHFTFGTTQTRTTDLGLDASHESPLLKLPAELRNNIYEHVSRDEKVLKFSAGKVVLPPLGGVCKQIRAELRGIFEQEVISNTALPIQVLVVNFNFKPLFEWLDEHDLVDRRPATGCQYVTRELIIWLECRPDFSLDPRIENFASPEERRLASLLLHNLTTTMIGWSSELDIHEARFSWRQRMSSEQYKQTYAADNFRRHLAFRRERSGHHYQIGIVAEKTWDRFAHLDFVKRKVPSAVQPDKPFFSFWKKMYYSIKSWGWMRTDVDQKIALMLREVCQSDCSEERMNAVATALTENPGRFHAIQVAHTGWDPWLPYVKWELNIVNLAVDEFSRMEKEVHAEKQYNLWIALEILEQEVKRKRSQMALEDASISSLSNPTAEQSLERDSSEDEFDKLTVMMAEWHL